MSRFGRVCVGVGLIAAMTVVMPPSAVVAAPGSPGSPQMPVVVYEEDFQALVPGTAGNVPVAIGAYTYTDRTTGALTPYYADPAWNAGSGNCNGWVLNFNSATPNPPDGCAVANGGATGTGQATSWWFLQHMAAFLGYMAMAGGYETGPTDHTANNVVASQTNGGTANNNYRQPAGIQAQAANVVMTAPGHYYAVAVDFAEVHCPNFPGGNSNWYAASETLYLEINGAYVPMIGDGTLAGGINICNSPDTRIVQPTQAMTGIAGWQSTYFAYTHLVSGAYRATSAEPLGLRVYNAQPNAIGNDVAFDNVRIVDVTPQVDKAFSPVQIAAGRTSRLTWTITNTADLDAKPGFAFTDALPAGLLAVAGSGSTTCDDPAAATPDGTVTVSADRTVASVAGNLAAGTESCTASVWVTSDRPGTYINDADNITSQWGIAPPDAATVTVVSHPALSLTKSAFTGATAGGVPVVTEAGQPVTYTMAVTNTGDVPVGALALADQAGFTGSGTLPAPTCAPVALGGTLAPGTRTTCVVTYTATQTDIDAGGTIANTATASGHGLGQAVGTTVTSNTATATVVVQPARSSLVLLKTVAITGTGGTPQTTIVAAGDRLHYSFEVTNTGVTTITGLGIVDGTSNDYQGVDTPGFSGTGVLDPVVCPSTTIAPGKTVTCTTTYTVTLDDLDLAEVLNAARAAGTDSQGNPVVSNVSGAMATTGADPGIAVSKGHLDLARTPAMPGDVVTFEFTVTNTGETLLTQVGVTDSLINIESPIECPEGNRAAASLDGTITLEAKESVVCSATYTLTQADIDAGQLINLQAQAHGVRTTTTTDPLTGEPATTEQPVFSPYATNELPLPARGSVTLVKSETLPAGGVTAAGQTIDYAFLITNTGNVTLKDLRISDPALAYVDAITPGFSGTGIWTWTMAICPQTALAAGAAETCHATYVVTQADVDAGILKNTATVSGVAPATTATSGPSTVELTIPAHPHLGLVKAASPATVSTPGETVTYTFTVTNDGNVTITDPVVAETSFTGTGTAPQVACPTGAVVPGQSVRCTATYTVTPADIEAGHIANTATVSGHDPDGGSTTSPPAEADVTASRHPALTLVKSSVTRAYTAGQAIVYTFTVTNTGNVIVDHPTVTDDHTTGTGVMGPVTCPAASLVPGQSAVCTGTYTATQADVDAGLILDYAIAHGVVRATGATVSSYRQSYDILAAQKAALDLTQTVTAANPEPITPGEKLTFTVTVTNTGKTTVTDLAVTDQLFSGSGPVPVFTCPATVLAPGQSLQCTAPYVVTDADATTGTVTNTVTMGGDAQVYVRGMGLEHEPVESNPAEAWVSPTHPPVVEKRFPTGGTSVPGGDTGSAAVLVLTGVAVLLTRWLHVG